MFNFWKEERGVVGASSDDDDGVDVVKASDDENDEPVSKRPRIEKLRASHVHNDFGGLEDEDFVSTEPPSYDTTQPDGFCPWVKARNGSTPTTSQQTQVILEREHSAVVVLDEEQRLSGEELRSPSLLEDDQFGGIEEEIGGGQPQAAPQDRHPPPPAPASTPTFTLAQEDRPAPTSTPEWTQTQFHPEELDAFGDPEDDLLLGAIHISQECVQQQQSQESLSEEERLALDAIEQEALQAPPKQEQTLQVPPNQEQPVVPPECEGSFDSADDALLVNAAASGGNEFSSQDDALLEQISLGGGGKASQNLDDDDRLLAAVDFDGIFKKTEPAAVDNEAPGCSKDQPPVEEEEDDDEDDAMMCAVADLLEFSRDINDDSWDGD